MRLAVGRKGQTGRGRGIPVPGGVAHPFLLNKEAADHLYSISMGDEVEAKDEWGEWSRATVVAVRGEGGWVSAFFVWFRACIHRHGWYIAFSLRRQVLFLLVWN